VDFYTTDDLHNLYLKKQAQATQLPTFGGAFKKFETRMRNWLPPLSTENSYREEERDSRVFLGRLVMNQQTNSIQIRIKYFTFRKAVVVL